MNVFPHVRVEGSAVDRGRQYGSQAADRVRRSVAAYRDVFAHWAGWDWATVRREAARFEDPIAAFRPAYLDEIRGIADGAGLDPGDVLAINVRTEVMFAAKARQVTGQRRAPDGCTAFAVVPAPGAGGSTLIGQNWDWLPHTSETVVVLEARQDEGPDFVTVVEAGLLAKTGMNSSGLGLVTNALVTDADTGAPGIPYHVALRAILDCATVSDALAALQSGERSSAANYLIAHRDGSAVDVEAAPGDFSRLYLLFPQDGVALHSNHFLSPRFDGKDVSVRVMPDSPLRLQRIRAGLRGQKGLPTLDNFRALLADHANYPAGLCCHPDPRTDPCDQEATVASVLMDLGSQQMHLADGNPCSAPYRQLDYREFLANPSPVAEHAG
ncbi:MAG: peptidase C45 [Actinobacteria bacterium]|nr:peptidase C45 [Actinomycetota bacterium]